MRTFLIRSAFFFVFAAVVTVGIFFFLAKQDETLPSLTKQVMDTVTEKTETVTSDTANNVIKKVPSEGIPLSSLPLTDAQKKTLETAHIDVSTFVLTPEMVSCASEKLGDERFTAITKGSTPTFIEVTKLLPCLGA